MVNGSSLSPPLNDSSISDNSCFPVDVQLWKVANHSAKMAYASQVQNDTQHPSSSLSFNTKLCLFSGNLGCDWEGLCYQEKTMTPTRSSSKTTKIALQPPIISRQIQTLASLESNYVSSEGEEEMEEEVDEIDQVEGEMEEEEEMEGEEEIEDDLDAKDGNNDGGDDYIDFCNLLTKSPASDAAVSRFVHTSFVTSSFSFSVINDEGSSEDDNEDDTDDNREGEVGNDSNDEDFSCWSAPRTNTFFGGFDPFAVSGLFIPSLLSTFTSRPPSIPGNSSNASDEDVDSEAAQKLKDINKKWLEMYSTSSEDNVTVVDAENCVTSHAIKVNSKKTVHFCDKTTFIDIVNEEEWAEDYESARKGPWEEHHRDQLRFTNRIESMRELLSKVLVAEHRATIFRKLYEATDLVTDGEDSLMDLLLTSPASS